MMKIFKIVLLALLIVSVNAKAAKWQKLKPLNAYNGSAYNLKENVAYMEIRWYESKKSKKVSKTLALYRKSLKSYPADVIAKFESLTPKYSTKADIGTAGNAFFIDVNGKMFQMDMRNDVVSLLDKLDTPAEVQLIQHFFNGENAQYYRKVSKGYETKWIYLIKGCAYGKNISLINKNISWYDAKFTLFRKGCKKRKNTKFIRSKKVSYENYLAIEMDEKENLYVIGDVKKEKKFDSPRFSVVEKYNTKGKRLWSRKLKDYAENIAVIDKTVYIFEHGNLVAKYTLNGKKKPSSKLYKIEMDKRKTIKQGEYLPEGLPNKREILYGNISDYVVDKKGNTYVVGSEITYPSGTPDEVPEGECGNVEEIAGALIAKLNSKGETVWAKVIDRND